MSNYYDDDDYYDDYDNDDYAERSNTGGSTNAVKYIERNYYHHHNNFAIFILFFTGGVYLDMDRFNMQVLKELEDFVLSDSISSYLCFFIYLLLLAESEHSFPVFLNFEQRKHVCSLLLIYLSEYLQIYRCTL